MVPVLLVIAAGVLFLAALAGAGRFGEMPDAVADQFVPELPERGLGPDDLRAARFATVLRGYSPGQVDRLLAAAQRSWEDERGASLQRRDADVPSPPADGDR